MKRIFDFVAALTGLAVVAPLLALLGICIKLDSPGPVFYCGIRAGRFGRPFRMRKLRTMVVDAEIRGGAETPADDIRITRIGGFLRRWKFDELPQLINVLCGEMSLVGPRPEVIDEVIHYTDEEKQLLLVRPGITDWASIKFRDEDELLRGSPDPHLAYHQLIRPEKVRLGLEYVRTNSMLTDFKILCRTVTVVVQPKSHSAIRSQHPLHESPNS